MKSVRKQIGGLGNLMFKQAFIIGKMLDKEIPDVYVQSEKYWKPHAEFIKQTFGEGIGESNKIALHIRRGDYLETDFYIDLWKTDYYKRAIDITEETYPGAQYIVFCRDNQNWDQDKADRQWCREHLGPILGDRFELPPKENTEVEDFNLMASCKALIMANSSFSWWAAYLGNQELTICPKNWFSDGDQRTELLDEWIKL